jgi:hypothetical protein
MERLRWRRGRDAGFCAIGSVHPDDRWALAGQKFTFPPI